MGPEPPYTVRYHENDQEVAIAGSLRPRDAADFEPVRECLVRVAASIKGTLYINLKRLRYCNHRAFLELARFLDHCRCEHPELRLKLVISSVVPWAPIRFAYLTELFPNAIVEQYDRAFYPGQGVIENDQLIPVLRAQTNIVWEHERELLRRHGLRHGMRVADICCGIGDFAVLLHKEFKPEVIVAVDPSRRRGGDPDGRCRRRGAVRRGEHRPVGGARRRSCAAPHRLRAGGVRGRRR